MTRKYAPKKLDDLIGNPKAHGELKEYIMNKNRVIVLGPPGVGKTAAVYAIGKELGWEVMEVNASDERKKGDMEEIARLSRMYTFTGEGRIILLDEFEQIDRRAWSVVEEILTYSLYPVVLTTNDLYEIPPEPRKKITNLCLLVRIRRPYMQSTINAVKKIAKEEGLSNLNYKGIEQQDIRNAINVAIYGGESYKAVSIFEAVKNFFVDSKLDDLDIVDTHAHRYLKDPAWLIDNAPKFLRGSALLEFYELLEIASRSDVSVLTLCPKGKGDRVNFPNLKRRGRALSDGGLS